MAKRKRTEEKTTIYKVLHWKLKMEQSKVCVEIFSDKKKEKIVTRIWFESVSIFF